MYNTAHMLGSLYVQYSTHARVPICTIQHTCYDPYMYNTAHMLGSLYVQYSTHARVPISYLDGLVKPSVTTVSVWSNTMQHLVSSNGAYI